jgi:hypothetical protein
MAVLEPPLDGSVAYRRYCCRCVSQVWRGSEPGGSKDCTVFNGWCTALKACLANMLMNFKKHETKRGKYTEKNGITPCIDQIWEL